MTHKIMLGVACASVIVSNASADPEIMQRSGKWEVKYDRDACHLAANFGAGDAQMVLRFSRYEPNDYFALALYGRQLPKEGTRFETTIDFGLAEKPIERFSLNGSAGTLRTVMFGNVRLDGWKGKSWNDKGPRVTPLQEGKVTGLDIVIKSKRPFHRYRLEFGPLAAPFLQLRSCTTELVRRWGYDPVVQAGLTRKPTPINSPQTWLNSKDFPETALRTGQTGEVQFRLDIDEYGKVLGCYVLDRTDPDAFAEVTCNRVRARAAFRPAVDANGQPVRSFYVQKVSWL